MSNKYFGVVLKDGIVDWEVLEWNNVFNWVDMVVASKFDPCTRLGVVDAYRNKHLSKLYLCKGRIINNETFDFLTFELIGKP